MLLLLSVIRPRPSASPLKSKIAGSRLPGGSLLTRSVAPNDCSGLLTRRQPSQLAPSPCLCAQKPLGFVAGVGGTVIVAWGIVTDVGANTQRCGCVWDRARGWGWGEREERRSGWWDCCSLLRSPSLQRTGGVTKCGERNMGEMFFKFLKILNIGARRWLNLCSKSGSTAMQARNYGSTCSAGEPLPRPRGLQQRSRTPKPQRQRIS